MQIIEKQANKTEAVMKMLGRLNRRTELARGYDRRFLLSEVQRYPETSLFSAAWNARQILQRHSGSRTKMTSLAESAAFIRRLCFWHGNLFCPHLASAFAYASAQRIDDSERRCKLLKYKHSSVSFVRTLSDRRG